MNSAIRETKCAPDTILVPGVSFFQRTKIGGASAVRAREIAQYPQWANVPHHGRLSIPDQPETVPCAIMSARAADPFWFLGFAMGLLGCARSPVLLTETLSADVGRAIIKNRLDMTLPQLSHMIAALQRKESAELRRIVAGKNVFALVQTGRAEQPVGVIWLQGPVHNLQYREILTLGLLTTWMSGSNLFWVPER